MARRNINLIISKSILPGHHALMKRGKMVWLGKIGAPIEDAVFDAITINPVDAQRMIAIIEGINEKNRL